MCREIEIYNTGTAPPIVISTIADAVQYFGLDSVRRHVTGLGYVPSGDDRHCLCGIDIESLCVEQSFIILSNSTPNGASMNLEVIIPWSMRNDRNHAC
jgi:hypothetical protein